MSVTVHRTNKRELIRHITYRFIPYEELLDVLKNDGEAFLEDSDERPLKRSTIWRAAKKLSLALGKTVRYDRSLLRIDGVDVLEGYAFSIAEGQRSPSPEGTAS